MCVLSSAFTAERVNHGTKTHIIAAGETSYQNICMQGMRRSHHEPDLSGLCRTRGGTVGFDLDAGTASQSEN